MLERMVRTLAHRGPDTFGYHVDGPAAIGIARLRVIDLVTGDQPIGNEDGTVHVALTARSTDSPRSARTSSAAATGSERPRTPRSSCTRGRSTASTAPKIGRAHV